VPAQSKTFHLGLKAEFYGYTHQEVSSYTTYPKKFWLSQLPAMYVIIRQDLSRSISIAVKPGISFRPDPGNFEFGLLIDYRIFGTKYLLMSGVNTYFVNKKFQIGQSVIESNNIYFILLGVGYQLSDRLAVDVSFHQALNTDFAFDTHNKHSNGWEGPSKLFNMVKLGLAATF
jgi:hypothetical protein